MYCRSRYPESTYQGVQLVYLPTIRHKYFDTLAHTFLTTVHLLEHKQDVALFCNAANAIFTIWPRIAGTPVALNVDGLERKRRKWNALAQRWYLFSEWLATILPTAVVSDAAHIARYYEERYRKQTAFIPYGAEAGVVATTAILQQLGLEPGRYFLYVSRMEPENNALLVRQAFETLQTDMRLAIIGDAPYAKEYIRAVKATGDPRIVIPGAIYGVGYRELQSHCFAYVHATEVGGTHPALIEAMGRGALTLYLQTDENSEVAGGAGIAFTPETLAGRLLQVLQMSAEERQCYKDAAMSRVEERYSWDAVTTDYEHLFESLLQQK